MTLDDFEKKLQQNKENSFINVQIQQMLELFITIIKHEKISFYRYNYEYNDFFYKYTLNKNAQKVEFCEEDNKSKRIILERDDIVYGYILVFDDFEINEILEKLLEKIIDNLHTLRQIEKSILGSDEAFNIFLFHDENLDMFAKNLKGGLEGLFNVDITLDTKISNHIQNIKSKDLKHIIIYLVDDEKSMKENEDILKSLNELIVVIGPNDHYLSMYCGKLGIQNYIPITSFKAQDLKKIILDKRNSLINKNKYGNKIIALSGVSGGIGTTSIAMNMSDLLAKNLPSKNILYVDLSTTKAISNLFLEKNPLPNKTIIDLINSSEFHLENNLQNGLVKIKENFYSITGIQKHIDKEFLEKDIFIEKFLEYISNASDYFNFIIIDLGIADASNLKSTIYDIVNELWLITQMNLPHISKVKTFYSLMKRAGLKEKISFIVNRYDSQNAISLSDVTSILNMTSEDKIQFDDLKIPNDYVTLGKCWNYCELASQNASNSVFVKKLEEVLEKKDFYKKDEVKTSSKSFFSSLFKKS